MNCMTCEADIPPSWVNAISKNECPGCGGPIMNETTKDLLDRLKEAMVKMPNDAEGLAGWLVSNFDLRPKGTIEATEFHRKKDRNMKVAGTNAFMERSGANKIISGNSKMSQLVQAMNSVAEAQYGSEGEPISVQEDEEAEEQEFLERVEAAKQAGKPLTAKELLANNSVLGNSGNSLSKDDLNKIKNLMGGNDVEQPLDDVHPLLRAERLKRLAAQQELQMSGGVGKVKRRDD